MKTHLYVSSFVCFKVSAYFLNVCFALLKVKSDMTPFIDLNQ